MSIDVILSDLMGIASPTGFGSIMRSQVANKIAPLVDSVEEDIRGNVICSKYASTSEKKTVALVAHYDQVGMIVTHIEESGLIRFGLIGVIDTQLFRGHKVQIFHRGRSVYGVVGVLPSNMRKEGEKKDVDTSDMWIDIGTRSREETLKFVSIGDFITWDSQSLKMANDIFSGCACDNKAGMAAVISVLEKLQHTKLSCNLITIFTSKEEIGFRSVTLAIQKTKPDIVIVVDTGHATDYPLVKKAKYGDVRIGEGCIIPIGMDTNNDLQDQLLQICDGLSIKCQCVALSEPSGSDANAIDRSDADCKIGMVLIPCRYMHSPIEVVSLRDINAVSDLLKSFCINLS